MLRENMKMKAMKFVFSGGADLLVDTTTCTMGLPLHWEYGGNQSYLIAIEGRVVTAFTGITGPVTIKVGFEGNPEALIQETDLSIVHEFLGASSKDHKFFCTRRSAIQDPPEGIVTFTSSSGNLEDLTAGEVEIVVIWLEPE